MNPDELRALADALEPMAKAPRFEDFDVPVFCAWVRACADAQPVAVPAGWKLVPVDPTPEMLASTSWPGCAGTDYAHMLAAAPAAPQAEPCIGNDSACPCQDGDACHYKDAADGTKAWPAPQAEPKRDPLHGLAPTHRCPACGAFWRQCDDASWNLRSASCCGLCDAGRVELVCWLDEPKREPNPDEVICPACTHQFRAIPENVQKQLWAKREPLSDEQIEIPDYLRLQIACTAAAHDVLVERRRQIEVEGWTPEHDDEHDTGALALAAAAYALDAGDKSHPCSQGARGGEVPPFWPWMHRSGRHREARWWKPSTPRRNLVKAGALILAEIERLDRMGGSDAE
jgi:hypothetical protein